MLSKYVWLISAEKISFVRFCCGSNKSNGLHNKGPHTRDNIKWHSFALIFCASTLNAHDNLCFPLRRAYLLLYVFTFMQESKYSSLFLFLFFSFCKHHVVRKDLGTYIQLDMGCMNYFCWHHPWGEYVVRRNYKPLSFYVSSWNFLLMCMRWVLAIIEDYMMVEYVELLLRLYWISWIAIAWWLRT